MSYFQFQYRAKITALVFNNKPDEDNLWRLNEDQQAEINASAALFAQETFRKFPRPEQDWYTGLKALCQLHWAFELMEKIRLAETVKSDIWRTTELIYCAFGTPAEEISHRIGTIEGVIGDYGYIEMLFPNRRKQTHAKARRILNDLAQEHNRLAPNFAMTDGDIDQFLAYLEKTELALFDYMLEQSNDAIYARHSWQTAEAFLQLKSFASFPESLMKIILKNSADQNAIRILDKNVGMGKLIKSYFHDTFDALQREFDQIGHRTSSNPTEFLENLHYHTPLVSHSSGENAYLAASLSLATCIRNFTSHLVVEDPDLLKGQYVRSIRAIISSIFLIWHAANRYLWIH